MAIAWRSLIAWLITERRSLVDALEVAVAGANLAPIVEVK